MDNNYRVEQLNNGIDIFVSDDHRFGTDAVLLADFAVNHRVKKACDFGTGCGIIPFLWLSAGKTADVTGVEIQKAACDMTAASIERNGLGESFRLINADLTKLSGVLPAGGFDLVTMNPPYKPIGTGIISESGSDKIARHETLCTVYDVAESAARLLKFGGRFCMCHRPERLADVIEALRGCGCEPKRLRFVQQRADTAPWLMLIEGKKGAKVGLKVLSPLILEGGFCDAELRRIYGQYAVNG